MTLVSRSNGDIFGVSLQLHYSAMVREGATTWMRPVPLALGLMLEKARARRLLAEATVLSVRRSGWCRRLRRWNAPSLLFRVRVSVDQVGADDCAGGEIRRLESHAHVSVDQVGADDCACRGRGSAACGPRVSVDQVSADDCAVDGLV